MILLVVLTIGTVLVVALVLLIIQHRFPRVARLLQTLVEISLVVPTPSASSWISFKIVVDGVKIVEWLDGALLLPCCANAWATLLLSLKQCLI